MLKRKLSLEQTWQKCVNVMWKEMIEVHWKRGMMGYDLKLRYFKKHPKRDVPADECYFCDYANSQATSSGYFVCSHCPGRLINKKFDCCNKSYHYNYKPKAFYRKLLQLNKKRISAREK